MMRNKKRPEPPPARDAHYNPRTEAELQAIISLRQLARLKEKQIAGNADLIRKMNLDIARNPGKLTTCDRWRAHVSDLTAASAALERAVAGIHREIGERLARLDDGDLAFLGA